MLGIMHPKNLILIESRKKTMSLRTKKMNSMVRVMRTRYYHRGNHLVVVVAVVLDVVIITTLLQVQVVVVKLQKPRDSLHPDYPLEKAITI